MKHIQEKLNENAPKSFSVKGNVNSVTYMIRQQHEADSRHVFGEGCVAAAMAVADNGDLGRLALVFDALCEKLGAMKDVTDAEYVYLGQVKASAEAKGYIKPNRDRLGTTPHASLLTLWDPEAKLSHGYDTEEDLREYLQGVLTKEEMAMAAKGSLMRNMQRIIEAAIASPGVDKQYVQPKQPTMSKMNDGSWAWRSVMGAIFHIGLAHKMATVVTKRGDAREWDEGWSYEAYVNLRSNRVHARIREADEECMEVGHYLHQELAEVQEMEKRLATIKRLVPFAEQLFPLIDLWNAIERWSHEPSEEFPNPLILNKHPADKDDATKRRELEDIFEVMETTVAKGKSADTQAFYEQLKAKADAALAI